MILYRGYDAEELERQYNARAAIPEHPEIFAGFAARSAAFRARVPCRLDLPYGDGENERLDFFPAGRDGAPLAVFIHGGYWRSLDKSDFSFVAEPLTAAGAHVALLNYALCPKVTVGHIVGQARAGLAWLHRNAAALGADPGRLVVYGHSAGGHLAAMCLVADGPAAPVKGALALSGLFDLEPIRHMSVQADVRLTAAEARALSPIHLRPAAAPLILAAGALEGDEFRRQSRDFAAAWKARGVPVETMEMPGRNHLTVVDDLAEPDGPLVGALRRML
jgi:arylformamidase